MEFERAAPIFDCGTSLWIPRSTKASFAPFAQNVDRQLDLAPSLDWPDIGTPPRACSETEQSLAGLDIDEAEAGRVAINAEYQADLIADAAADAKAASSAILYDQESERSHA